MDQKEKLKNIKDLEYNRLLNLENIFLALIGGIAITILFSEEIPSWLNKVNFIVVLTGISFFISLIINNKLKLIIKEIKSL